jgi:ATP-dependent helicase HrpA
MVARRVRRFSVAEVARREEREVRLTYPEELPITARREELLACLASHQVVIVAGETGSGKSTQLPKLCLELGRGRAGMIGHTQPRRIAARSVGERVAEELGTELGDLVGYAVRFTDQVGPDTLVKVMTDGLLLAEIQRDPELSRYDTIIVDEAHERSLNIDFLLGYLHQLLSRRDDLKLVITSATIDTAALSAHFGDAPVIEVSGRTYPVEVRYRPLTDDEDQNAGIADAVRSLLAEAPGDILVFCSGEREIRDAADTLAELALPATEIVSLHGRLSAGEQHRVFERHVGRRVVLATNVAETSITVPGIRAVVDTGTARISRYSKRTKVQRLPIEAVSQASARQRAGRCGRVGPGVCVRLYSQEDHDARPVFTEPEIQRTNLASVILQMAALGLGTVEAFPFVDAPDRRSIADGIAVLEELGALRVGSQPLQLTARGRQLARLPVDPRLGAMVVAAAETGALAEVLVIVAGLAIQDPRERPAANAAAAAQAHARFRDPRSDFLGILSLWEYVNEERRNRTANQFRRMCRDEYLNYPRLREWQDVHSQLRHMCGSVGLEPTSTPATPEQIHRALLAGLLSHIGYREPDGFEYRGARAARFSVAPGSVLFKASPRWVMAAELVETSRLWARVVAPIEPGWAEAAAAHLVKRSHGDPWWDAARGSAVTSLRVTLYGLPLVTARTVQYGRVDPVRARELLIRHALVGGEWGDSDPALPFLHHNAAVVAAAADLGARLRRDDLPDEEALVSFYDARLPADVLTTRHLDRWWRSLSDPSVLEATLDDVVPREAPLQVGSLTDSYPDRLRTGGADLAVTYRFAPGASDDGVTVTAPVDVLNRIDPGAVEWGIPGLRAELVTAVVRALPKPIRRALGPTPEAVPAVIAALGDQPGDLTTTLAQVLSRQAGLTVAGAEVRAALGAVADHLRVRYEVVADDGTPLAASRDLLALERHLDGEVRAALSRGAGQGLERRGLTAWPGGDIPRRVDVSRDGRRITAFPALVDEGTSVAVALVASAEEQADLMWNGTRRLLRLVVAAPAKTVTRHITSEVALAMAVSPYRSPQDLAEDVITATLDVTMAAAGGPAWTESGWRQLVERVRAALPGRLDRVGADAVAILVALRPVVSKLAAASGPRLAIAATDVENHVARLVYPGMISGLGADRLADVARYLRAAERRLDRLPDNVARDAELTAQVQALERELDAVIGTVGLTDAAEEAMWMLQELRVSLFAQSVGAKGQVSVKRVRAALARAAAW